MALTATFVDADTLTVAGDYTADFVVNRKVKANCGVDGYRYCVVSASAYGDPNTTVDMTADSDDLTANLTEVVWSVVKPGASGNVALHAHSDEDTGDDVATAAPGVDSVNVAASSEGTAHSVAKSDHTHNLDESIAPTWAGEHDFQAAATFQEVVSLAATKATTLLTVNQTGTGDVAEFQDGGNATVRIPDGGGIVLVPQAGGVSAIAGLLYYDNTAVGFERLKLRHEGHGYPVPVDPRNGLRNVSVCTTYV